MRYASYLSIFVWLLLFVGVVPCFAIDAVTIKAVWKQQLPSAFGRLDISDSGDMVFVSLENHPASTEIIAFDHVGRKLWSYKPEKGKVLSGGISSKGDRIVCYEFWAEEEGGPANTIVHVFDGITGKEVCKRLFYGPIVKAKISSDGKSVICSDTPGGVIGLYDATKGDLAAYWEIRDVKPQLPKNVNYSFGEALKNTQGAIIGDSNGEVHYIDSHGNRSWLINLNPSKLDLISYMSLSPSDRVLTVNYTATTKWSGNPLPTSEESASTFTLRSVNYNNVAIYDVNPIDQPFCKPISANGWMSSAENSNDILEALSLYDADKYYTLLRCRDTLQTVVFDNKARTQENNVRKLAGYSSLKMVSMCWAKQSKLIAALGPIPASDPARKFDSLIQLLDVDGDLITSTVIPGPPALNHAVSISENAETVYAVINNELQAFKIEKGVG